MPLFEIAREIKRQLSNTPFFATKPLTSPVETPRLDYLQKQIEKAVQERKHYLIFLLGPFGSGKSTVVNYFVSKHPNYKFINKSFIKINTLDFAFLRLTSYWSRTVFFWIGMLLAIGLIRLVPQMGALPFMLFLIYFFVKNWGNLIYILHEVLDNLFSHRLTISILEDLERSSLNLNDQWAFLANLWQHKRTYIIPLGYSSDDKEGKFKMMEYAMKLDGEIIEIYLDEKVNYEILKKLDPDIPFQLDKEDKEYEGWLSLFTPREMLMIEEQARLRAVSPHLNKQTKYIHICLEFLCKKLGIPEEEIIFDEKTKEIRKTLPKEYSSEQIHYLESFTRSIIPELGLKMS